MSRLALPFLADETAGDRNLLRLALTLVAGAAAALVGLLVFGLIAIAAFTWVAAQLSPGGPAELVPFNELLKKPSLAEGDLRLSLALIVMIPVTAAGAIFSFLVVSRLIVRRALHSYLTRAPKLRWGFLAFGLLANLVLFAPLVLVENWGTVSRGEFPLLRDAHGLSEQALFITINLIFLLLGAFAEETLFRGWLLRHVAAVVRSPWAGLGLTAVVFTVAHMEFSAAPLIALAIMGAGFAWMTLRTGGIEVAVGVHTANNLLLAVFQGPPGVPEGSDWTLNAENLMDFGATTLSYVAIAEIAVRFLPKRREPVEAFADGVAVE